MKRIALGLGVASIIFAGCGEGSSQDQKAHEAVKSYYVHNYIERQIFNHRLEVADDPATVLFCTAFPFDAEPYTTPIAGKLVSGSKRPDKPYYLDDKGSEELPDPQGMYGETVPYRFGFTPGGVYVDFTDVPTVCTTQAINFKKTSIGLVAVANTTLTRAGKEAEAVLKAGLKYNPQNHFEGYSDESKRKAQAILDGAATGETVASSGKKEGK